MLLNLYTLLSFLTVLMLFLGLVYRSYILNLFHWGWEVLILVKKLLNIYIDIYLLRVKNFSSVSTLFKVISVIINLKHMYSYYITLFIGLIAINIWYYFIGYDLDIFITYNPNIYIKLHILLYFNLFIKYLFSLFNILGDKPVIKLILQLILIALLYSYLYDISLIALIDRYRVRALIILIIPLLRYILKQVATRNDN
jgi:hypothetical protein